MSLPERTEGPICRHSTGPISMKLSPICGTRAGIHEASISISMPKDFNFLSQLTGSFGRSAAGNATVAMIEAAYRHHEMNWRYVNCEISPEKLGDAVRGAR